MSILNFEFKAKSLILETQEKELLKLNPEYIGEDQQKDTYFNVAIGRLKLREGDIENALIFYEREDIAGAKQSKILLYQHKPDKALKDILIKVHGIKVIVDKTRRIYFINNVKFHFDTVIGLGTFIEVEAIDTTGNLGMDTLQKQCQKYATLFGIQESDYLSKSYSDLIIENSKSDNL